MYRNMDHASDCWKGYLAKSDPVMRNCSLISSHLAEASPRLFVEADKMKVNILQLPEGRGPIQEYIIDTDESLELYLADGRYLRDTFISISAINSTEPLRITDTAMERLLSHHDISPDIIDLLFYFANGEKQSEIGPGSMVSSVRVDGSYDIRYRYNYVEHAGKSWATRQLCVYHHWIPHGPGNTWVFLHPKDKSVVQTRLREAVGALRKENGGDCFTCHLLVLSSYFGTWRQYITKLAGDIGDLTNDALTLNLDTEAHYQKCAPILRKMYLLEDKIIPLSSHLLSMLGTINSLRKLHGSRKPSHGLANSSRCRDSIRDELLAYETRLKGHLASVKVFEKRISGVLTLLTAALNNRSQAKAVDINKRIWSLTKDTVDDSATVRAVTIVTLIYLPASFVTSLLGTNLFIFQTSDEGGFQVSSQFWVFVILTVPLMIVTLGYWYWKVGKQRKERNKRRKKVEEEKKEIRDTVKKSNEKKVAEGQMRKADRLPIFRGLSIPPPTNLTSTELQQFRNDSTFC